MAIWSSWSKPVKQRRCRPSFPAFPKNIENAIAKPISPPITSGSGQGKGDATAFPLTGALISSPFKPELDNLFDSQFKKISIWQYHHWFLGSPLFALKFKALENIKASAITISSDIKHNNELAYQHNKPLANQRVIAEPQVSIVWKLHCPSHRKLIASEKWRRLSIMLNSSSKPVHRTSSFCAW